MAKTPEKEWPSNWYDIPGHCDRCDFCIGPPPGQWMYYGTPVTRYFTFNDHQVQWCGCAAGRETAEPLIAEDNERRRLAWGEKTPTFEKDISCPKCGNDIISMNLHYGHYSNGYTSGQVDDCAEPYTKWEHLERQCGRCGWRMVQKPLDFKF